MKEKSEIKIEWVDPGNLVPYEKNPRKHEDDQVDEIVRQISVGGWDVPIVTDENLVIIKGHGRRLAALKMGLEEVPVIRRHGLSDEEKIAIRIGDNKVGELSDWDKDLLSFELGTLDRAGFDLSATSLTDLELDELTPAEGLEDEGLPEPDGAGGGSKDKNFTIQYTLIFNTLEEQQEWFEFLGRCKSEYPGKETVAQRVLEFVKERG